MGSLMGNGRGIYDPRSGQGGRPSRQPPQWRQGAVRPPRYSQSPRQPRQPQPPRYPQQPQYSYPQSFPQQQTPGNRGAANGGPARKPDDKSPLTWFDRLMLHFADVSPLDLVPEDDPNRRKVEQQVHDLMKVSLAISAVLIMGTIVYGYLSYMAGA